MTTFATFPPFRPGRIVILYKREFDATMNYDEELPPLRYVPLTPRFISGVAKRTLKRGELVTLDDIDLDDGYTCRSKSQPSRWTEVIAIVFTVVLFALALVSLIVPWWFGALYIFGAL